MTKNQLIKEVAVSEGLHLSTAFKAVNGLLRVVKETLAKGEDIAIAGFGTLAVTDVPERQGINPQTRESITIPAHKALRLRVGKEVREMLNGR